MAREQGFEDTIKKDFSGIQIVDKRYGWADRAKSLDVAENMLTAHSDLDAMFASNESSAVGAAQAIKGRNAKVKLVGFDWSPGLLDDLKSGLIDSLVVQDPFRMGHDAVDRRRGKTERRHPAKDPESSAARGHKRKSRRSRRGETAPPRSRQVLEVTYCAGYRTTVKFRSVTVSVVACVIFT